MKRLKLAAAGIAYCRRGTYVVGCVFLFVILLGAGIGTFVNEEEALGLVLILAALVQGGIGILTERFSQQLTEDFRRIPPNYKQLEQNHHLVEALGVAMGAVVESCADGMKESESGETCDAVREVARLLRKGWLERMIGYRGFGEFAGMLHEQSIPQLLRPKERRDEAFWKGLVDDTIESAKAAESEAPEVSETVRRRLARELNRQAGFMMKQVLKYDMAHGTGEAWAAYQIEMFNELAVQSGRLPEDVREAIRIELRESHKKWLEKVRGGLEAFHGDLLRTADDHYRQIVAVVREEHEKTRDFVSKKSEEVEDHLVEEIRENRRLIQRTTVKADLHVPVPLPEKPPCFGRDEWIRDLVDALLEESVQPIIILGGPGIGKGTIGLNVLRDHRVMEKFPGQILVNCEAAETFEGLVDAILLNAGFVSLPPPNQRVTAIHQFLQDGEFRILFLDNFEVPWEPGDNRGEVERLLARLAGISTLRLMVSLRGEEKPAHVHWHRPNCSPDCVVKPLEIRYARQAFTDIAGHEFANDPLLEKLCNAVGCVPLPVVLLAHQAAGCAGDLEPLWRRWETEGLQLLNRGEDRLNSAEVSYELSIHGPRMTDASRRLLSLLAVLPSGVARADLTSVFPDDSDAAFMTLKANGLLSASDPDRINILSPLRNHVSRRHPSPDSDLKTADAFYLALALEGGKTGTAEAQGLTARMVPEVANIETVLDRHLLHDCPSEIFDAVLGFGEFQLFSGFGDANTLESATEEAYRKGDSQREANCIQCLGDIALRRSDHDVAREHYEEALPLYRRVGDVLGEANCIRSLGDIALRRSDHDVACERYEEALPLFRRVGSVLGEANCIRSLGNIALRRSDHDAARERFEEAFPLHRRVGDVLGEANCIMSLGDIALLRSDHDVACERFEEALPLFRRVGSVLGEANCIGSLGNVALRRSDHDVACERYEEALPLFRRVGDVLGEANCIASLGDIALYRSDHDVVRERYEEALELYSRIPEPYSMGQTHRRLARISEGEERIEYVRKAKRLWEGIKREDLVESLKREFSDVELESED